MNWTRTAQTKARRAAGAIAREPAPTRTAKMSPTLRDVQAHRPDAGLPDGRSSPPRWSIAQIRDAETTVCSISSCLTAYTRSSGTPTPTTSLRVLQARRRPVLGVRREVDLPHRRGARDVSTPGSPNGTHILTVAEFNVRCAVWSLLDKSCVYLRQPKYADAGIDFSPNGKFILVCERRECKDFITVVSCATWTTAARFQVATTDLADATWSPDGTAIAVWDALTEHSVLIYRPDGTKLASYKPSDGGAAAGVRCAAWCPRGGLLATGALDQRVRLFSHVSWRMLAELAHPDAVVFPTTVAVYREVEEVDGVLVDSPSRFVTRRRRRRR